MRTNTWAAGRTRVNATMDAILREKKVRPLVKGTRPASATFRFDRSVEPEPMPEPKKYRSRNAVP
jgi:hypothetical protein